MLGFGNTNGSAIAQTAALPRCNACGSTEFGTWKKVENTLCTKCGSRERARMMFHLIEHFGLLKPGNRCLHFAPETGLANRLCEALGAGYEPVDIDPDRYKDVGAKRFDLCKDTFSLPSEHYDLILHNHVLEHLPCSYAGAFVQLRRSLKVGGMHIFSVPKFSGNYAEDQNALSEKTRIQRFRQYDHVRGFGRKDFNLSIGSLVDLSASVSWNKMFPPDVLRSINVRDERWRDGPRFMIACRRRSHDGAELDELMAPVRA